jgi:hypothetical protein
VFLVPFVCAAARVLGAMRRVLSTVHPVNSRVPMTSCNFLMPCLSRGSDVSFSYVYCTFAS